MDDIHEEGVCGVEADTWRHELEVRLGGVQACDPAQACHALTGVTCTKVTTPLGIKSSRNANTTGRYDGGCEGKWSLRYKKKKGNKYIKVTIEQGRE